MPRNTLLVDRTLGAVPMSRVLEVRSQLRVEGKFDNATSTLAERPVLEGNQTLEPDVIYGAQRNATIKYYLPRYQVAVEGGHPAVELRYKAGDGGEIGRLTITLTWTPPPAPGMQLRVIEHVTGVTLGYRVPVQAVSGNTTAPTVERTMALQPLASAGDLLMRSTTVFTDKGLFDTIYQALRSPEQGATLDLLIRARVGVRTWNQVVVGKAAVPEQMKMLAESGVLFTEMLHTESLSTIRTMPAGRARVNVRDASPDMRMRVEATRAVVVARPEAAAPRARRQLAAGVQLGPARIMASPQLKRPVAGAPAAAAPALRVEIGAAAAPVRLDPPVLQVAAKPHTAAARLQPQVSGVVLARMNTPKLADAVAASDLRIAGVKAVPIRAALDTERRPAIVNADLDNRQRLPFTFDPANVPNRAVFVTDQNYSEAIHLLVPIALVGPDGATHTIYRDSLMPDVVHMPPSGFRLERETSAPYLPALTFVASDFSTTTDSGTQAEVLFRVAAAYRLEPWVNPDLLELARTQLDNRALQFTTGTAAEAKLTLELDILGDQKLRAEATIDPAVGITDTLDLDYQAFVRLWREHLNASGVRGTVSYRLFDGSQANADVLLSLRETSAELFDVTLTGPVPDQPGRYRVHVRNRVESPAHMTGFPPELLAGGGVAHAVNVAALQNRKLQPQETCEVDYDVTGTTSPLSEFSPAILGHIEPDPGALLRLLMITQGYSSLAFSVTVSAAEGVFANAAATAEPLTGLLVEFDDGTKTRLTPSKTSSEVTVVGRLLDQILGTADDKQRYFYRVTNLHASGEGARTSWTEGNGSVPLPPVGRAGGGFDF